MQKWTDCNRPKSCMAEKINPPNQTCLIMDKEIQKIIYQLNKTEGGLSSAYQPLFIFLWLFKQNEIRITQSELSSITNIKKRTLRQQLYNLRECGYIEYNGHWGSSGKTIKLIKHSHDE